MDAMDTPVTLECTKRERSKNLWTVIARRGDDVLHVGTLDITKTQARREYIGELCTKKPGIDAEQVESGLVKKAAEALTTDTLVVTGEEQDPLNAMSEPVKESARAMLRDPELIRIVIDDIAALGVAGEPKLAAAVYLIGTSRLLDTPLAGIVQGPTSSGKSYVIERVGRMFPPETIIRAHKMTPEALVHMTEGALVHRFVVAGERMRRRDDKAADATRSLREMLSDGNLSKLIPLKQPDGTITTTVISQPGPIAYVESTTVQEILDEDRNRCIVLSTDERAEQTRRIISAMARRKASGGPSDRSQDLIQKHHAAQRMLTCVRVQIPFAVTLGSHFPSDRTDARRSFGHTLSMIEAVTLLYQFQHIEQPSDEVAIMATREDYEIARRLLAEPMARSSGNGLSDAAMRFYERLGAQVSGNFTTAYVARVEGIIEDMQTIRKYVRSLARTGYLDVVEPTRGNKPAVYQLASHPPDDTKRSGLPDADTVFADAAREGAECRRVTT